MSTGGRSADPGRRLVRGPGPGLLGALLLVTSLALAGCGTDGGAGPTAASAAPGASAPAASAGATIFPTAARRPVPAVTARTLDGRRLAVRDLTGSGVVVINVWASWCTSCRAESAALAAVAQELPGRAVQFLGVDEEDSLPAARSFLARTATAYPQLSDPDGDILHAFSLLPQTGIPSTLLLDPHGRMAARVIGPVTRDGLRALIRSVQGVS